LECGPGAIVQVPAVVRRHFPDRPVFVVTDETCWRVAGQTVMATLQAAGVTTRPPFIFPDAGLYAEHSHVERLEAALRAGDATPIAVGSGTINDLTKLSAHRVGRPYLCVATAASMDGYTAFGASITHHGSKLNMDCLAPRAVVADLDIICRAPPEMTASGYADLLAKVPAGADWMLADALGVEAIEPRPWGIVQGGLRPALADPAGARAGRVQPVSGLVEGLMLAGFAMQRARNSRPAAGVEHQFSHLWDMEHHTHNGKAPSHGFKVGIGTLAVTAFYQGWLNQPLDRLDVDACCTAWPEPAQAEQAVRAMFAGAEFADGAVRETLAKHVSRAELRQQLTRLRSIWPQLRDRLRGQLLPFAEVQRRLRLVGAPAAPEEIGLTRERVRQSFRKALAIRQRFTVLDVAARTGTLDTGLAALFGPGAPWETAPEAAGERR
jgi:glycerol-1-phosphate dehydrogenase [NAD(P)+]